MTKTRLAKRAKTRRERRTTSRRLLARGLQRLALELHMDGNIMLAIPALWHGFTFIDSAGPVEYGAVALILLLTISGR